MTLGQQETDGSKAGEMRGSSDAMGRLLYEFWKGKDVLEIVERDDGYTKPTEYRATLLLLKNGR